MSLKQEIDTAWDILKHVPVGDADAYNVAYRNWQALRNTCPSCLTRDHLVTREKDRQFEQAELWCDQCGLKIRTLYY